jgi:hypothetical protein
VGGGGRRISKRKPDNVFAFKFEGGTTFGEVVDMVDFVGEFAETIIKAKKAVEVTRDDNLGKWLQRLSVCQVVFTDTIYVASGDVIGPVVHRPLPAWTLGTHHTSHFIAWRHSGIPTSPTDVLPTDTMDIDPS